MQENHSLKSSSEFSRSQVSSSVDDAGSAVSTLSAPSSRGEDNLSLLDLPEIKEVMGSDVAINALLTKLKQSLLLCEEFTKFIRKKYILENDHVEELSKQYRPFFNDVSPTSTSLKKMIHDILGFDGKIAAVRQSYVQALMKMYDELSALLLTLTKMRKSIKERSRLLEREVGDAIHTAEKAQHRYNSLCQDYEKLKQSDPYKTKLTLRGSKTTREQEDDLLRKIDVADVEYKQKVNHSTALRNRFLSEERPKIVSQLKDLILELDTAITIQLQKYAIRTEAVILKSGITVSPIDTEQSMKHFASSVSNEKDLYNFLNKYHVMYKNNKYINRNLIPVEYKTHPIMSKRKNRSRANSTKSPPTFAVDPSRNSIPKRIISTHNETPFSSKSTPNAMGMLVSPSSSTYNTLSTTNGGVRRKSSSKSSTEEVNSVSQNFKTLDPSGAKTKLTSDVPKPNGADAERPISHIQTDESLPPGLQNNFQTFGRPLQSLVEYEQDMVPSIVKECISMIEENGGLTLEGIYRKSVNISEINKFKQLINDDPTNVKRLIPSNHQTDNDIHLTASILKTFFASLPDSLLPSEGVSELKSCLTIDDEIIRKNYLHGLIYKLPDPQYWTLRALIFHLQKIAANEAQNKMNTTSLSIIWGPTIVPKDNEDPNNVAMQIELMENIFSVTDQAFEAD